jgi:hypothetical protein
MKSERCKICGYLPGGMGNAFGCWGHGEVAVVSAEKQMIKWFENIFLVPDGYRRMWNGETIQEGDLFPFTIGLPGASVQWEADFYRGHIGDLLSEADIENNIDSLWIRKIGA